MAEHISRRGFLAGTAALAGGWALAEPTPARTIPAPAATQRRSCYNNFAEHLLNAFNPNMIYPELPYRWSDDDWFHFLDMIGDFGFTHFEFWLVPRLFSRAGLEQPFGEAFAR